MALRGIRGAITAEHNTEEAILESARMLLLALQDSNGFQVADIAAAWFTSTSDLNAAFPAKAARLLGWTHVALMDALEIEVPGSLPGCIRVLLLWNTEKSQEEILCAYLRGAAVLRPDLTLPGKQEEK
ncbi:MAG: chorismate mutase [Anaerolineae bacterium]